MTGTFKLVVRLTLICIIAGLCLGATYNITSPAIARLDREQAEQAYREMLPEADSFEDVAYDAGGDYAKVTAVKAAVKGSEVVGWCVNIKSPGYKSDIALILGIRPDGTLAGLRVGANEETAGLGSKIAEDDFYLQFAEATPQLTISKSEQDDGDPSTINAISGATISSRAVMNAANIVYRLYEDQLK
jgi:electron transport complex protein RnfG